MGGFVLDRGGGLPRIGEGERREVVVSRDSLGSVGGMDDKGGEESKAGILMILIIQNITMQVGKRWKRE